MEPIKYLSRSGVYAALLLCLVPSLAIAMLIYDWQAADDPNSSITGTMLFADGVNFGDSVDPLSSQLVQFSFSNPILSDWNLSDFAYGNFLVPDAAGVDLDPTGFAIPDSTGAKKKAASKTRSFGFQRGDAFLDFTVAGAAKKKAATKNGDPTIIEPFPLWSWSSTIIVDCPPNTACKKAAKTPSGDGYWVLRDGPVPVPEPATFLLTLLGLGIIVALYRRGRRRLIM